MAVEDVGAGVVDGTADGRGGRLPGGGGVGPGRGVVPGGGVDGGLGGAVDVGHPAARHGGADGVDGAGGKALTGQHHQVRVQRRALALGEDVAQG